MAYITLILALPLVSFIIIVAFGRQLGRVAGTLSSAAMGLSLLLALANLASTPARSEEYLLPWLPLGNAHLEVGLIRGHLSAMMLVVVTVVSTMVQIYSNGYMEKDPRFPAFFANLSLFTFSMLGLVVAPNLLEMYMFWELVGLSSYLLIGFWFHKPSAARAAVKSFVVTRIGDLGFLIGILILFSAAGTLDFGQLSHLAQAGKLSGWVLTASAILIFAGAVGKSAQFPLHTWLADAMEGPTPVSALIHAATMVAAGVYLVARAYPIFATSPVAMETVAVIGGFTAILAASIALVQHDIKRVIAYSTMSQLGYMMLGLGVGAYSAGLFHLFNHAFFKALLFLAAGSVIHGLGNEQDLRRMGGLWPHMRLTGIAFLCGALALSGIPPFSGFYSKDAIITAAASHPVLYVFAVLGALMTAFYIFRVFFLTFTGEPRHHAHPHEAPWSMMVPVLTLAFLALTSGFLFRSWFAAYLPSPVGGPGGIAVEFLSPGVFVGLLGIILAWVVYGRPAEKLREAAKGLVIYPLLLHKYYFDELYDAAVVRPTLALGEVADNFDRRAVDGVVNGVAWLADLAGTGMRYVETGRVQFYALVTFFGAAALLLAVQILGVSH